MDLSDKVTMRDPDIRHALKHDLATEFESDARIVEEMTISTLSGPRIDVAVINGFLHGYEIKSDVDSLRRLPTQTEAYGAIFDYLTLVVSDRHIEKCTSVIPDWWGISLPFRLTSRSSIKIVPIRKAVENRSADPGRLIRLLRRGEMESLLLCAGFDGNPKKLKCYEMDELALQTIPLLSIQKHVRVSLKMRKNWRSAPEQC